MKCGDELSLCHFFQLGQQGVEVTESVFIALLTLKALYRLGTHENSIILTAGSLLAANLREFIAHHSTRLGALLIAFSQRTCPSFELLADPFNFVMCQL